MQRHEARPDYPWFHGPTEDGIYVDLDPYDTRFLEYTDDQQMLDNETGITRESAEINLRQQGNEL